MKKPYRIAIILSTVIAIWMAVGMVFKEPEATQVDTSKSLSSPSSEITVEVCEQHAVSTVSYIVAHGNVIPDREVVIRAETKGKINHIAIKKGNEVNVNTVLAMIDMDDRTIRLERPRAQIAVEKHKYDSLKNLGIKGYTSQTRIDEALANCKTAEADEKQILLDIAHTNIKAPFAGVIDAQSVEQGDYVDVADALFTIVDNNPLVVSVFVPQQEIRAIKKDSMVQVTLATGEKKQGSIRFIAPRANAQTRSFHVDIEIPNLDKLPSGTSATVRIAKTCVMAHFISPALITLNEHGEIGIKTVNDAGVVSFRPIKIISSKADGIYVTGLPDKATIISNGQGFVRSGDTVAYVKNDTIPVKHVLASKDEAETTDAHH